MITDRRFQRFPYQLKMTVDKMYRQDHEELQNLEAEIDIVDISRRGLGFVSSSELPLDFYFNANIIFDSENHFLCVLKIVRREQKEDGYSYGCEFVGLAETLASLIEEYNTLIRLPKQFLEY